MKFNISFWEESVYLFWVGGFRGLGEVRSEHILLRTFEESSLVSGFGGLSGCGLDKKGTR